MAFAEKVFVSNLMPAEQLKMPPRSGGKGSYELFRCKDFGVYTFILLIQRGVVEPLQIIGYVSEHAAEAAAVKRG